MKDIFMELMSLELFVARMLRSGRSFEGYSCVRNREVESKVLCQATCSEIEINVEHGDRFKRFTNSSLRLCRRYLTIAENWLYIEKIH